MSFSLRQIPTRNPGSVLCLFSLATVVAGIGALALSPSETRAQTPDTGMRAMLAGQIERPLRYTPEGEDFVIVNGNEFFNRPLYGGSSSFRVDAGDRPEFSFYLPGRGGNLRIGFETAAGVRWLHEAQSCEARYHAGTMRYVVRDPLLGPGGSLLITALAPKSAEGLILRLEIGGTSAPIGLIVASGGITGARGSRDGDIGTEKIPIREYFQLKPEYCEANKIIAGTDSFTVQAKRGALTALLPVGSAIMSGDANKWNDLPRLLASSAAAATDAVPRIALARFKLIPGRPAYLSLQKVASEPAAQELLPTYKEVAASGAPAPAATADPRLWTSPELPSLFEREQSALLEIARRVTVDTPDSFLNAALPALNIAADAVWDEKKAAYLHGGVAWRVRLLGWRVSYAGDSLGWHERTRAHFDGYAAQQNTSPVPASLPASSEKDNRSRNETALHTNGDMTASHYDMNLVGVDAFFRHLLWTGDLDYARKQWPVIERHLAWERRLFRREFGAENLPLYEAYACIWASDDLSYNGGGGTHSSAYNLYHNRMAARVARLLGLDPAPYEREASLIERGMNQNLWLNDRGWFAEWKDVLGLQRVHPESAAWTFYHTVDSEVPSPLQAWQMTRQVDTRLPHIPVQGAGVPGGMSTIATTNWLPYTWSLNNVVMAETVHTALGLWQSGRPEAAYPLFGGALLDSMYLGICPGNVGMSTWYDVNRRESQRDFGDGIGSLSRAVIEGVFGITPDLLAGELHVRPGFPATWDHARIHHPDFDIGYTRKGDTDTFELESRFARPVALRLDLAARHDDVASITVNGQPATFSILSESVGHPRIRILAPASTKASITVRWQGAAPAALPPEATVLNATSWKAAAGARIVELSDPQGVLKNPIITGDSVSGTVVGTAGHRTVFARVSQGKLVWWQPLAINIQADNPNAPTLFTTDWNKPTPAAEKLELVPLDSIFNDRVTRIFRNAYLSPRPPSASLALPTQGFGSWCKPAADFEVDDSGLRAAAAKNNGRITLPNGVPLLTPGTAQAPNIAFVSQWDNYPREITIPLTGHSGKGFLLMAGSTWAMQSRIDNGELVVAYTDGTSARVALENPTTWWPIDQDYFIDDYAFARPGPLPLRVNLKTAEIRVLDAATFKGLGGKVPGGAATVLDLSLDPAKELKSITIRALANDVVIGLMSITLARP
ncbi:MAG: hypothetical protein RIQ79_2185 [Verrucomicrobiota bacterium]